VTAEETIQVAEELGYRAVWDGRTLELEALYETTVAPPKFLLEALKAQRVGDSVAAPETRAYGQGRGATR
jgi:hypothetical protein